MLKDKESCWPSHNFGVSLPVRRGLKPMSIVLLCYNFVEIAPFSPPVVRSKYLSHCVKALVCNQAGLSKIDRPAAEHAVWGALARIKETTF